MLSAAPSLWSHRPGWVRTENAPVRPHPPATATDGATGSAAKLEKGDFAGALDPYTALRKRAEKEVWAIRMWERIEKAQEAIVAAATEALDDLEADKDGDPAKAKADLTALLPRLRGTGLEKRAKELLATL